MHPETPEEGRTLEELFAGRDIDIPALLARLQRVAADLNLPWGRRTMTFNSRRATELGKWAEDLDRGDAFHDAVFKAYFRDGLNIADLAVLKNLCQDLGLDPAEAERVLLEESYKKVVDDDWAYARRLGITAVPTFVTRGRALVGAQPYQELERLIKAASGSV